MNITTPTFKPRLLALAIFATLASSASLVCSAADGSDIPQIKVHYGDLNVSSTQGAATLYHRIRIAAEAVCSPLNGRGLAHLQLSATCVQNAVANAVKDVGEPALVALYNAKTGAAKPILLASSQTR